MRSKLESIRQNDRCLHGSFTKAARSLHVSSPLLLALRHRVASDRIGPVQIFKVTGLVGPSTQEIAEQFGEITVHIRHSKRVP